VERCGRVDLYPQVSVVCSSAAPFCTDFDYRRFRGKRKLGHQVLAAASVFMAAPIPSKPSRIKLGVLPPNQFGQAAEAAATFSKPALARILLGGIK
jgi:hypothetical protein